MVVYLFWENICGLSHKKMGPCFQLDVAPPSGCFNLLEKHMKFWGFYAIRNMHINAYETNDPTFSFSKFLWNEQFYEDFREKLPKAPTYSKFLIFKSIYFIRFKPTIPVFSYVLHFSILHLRSIQHHVFSLFLHFFFNLMFQRSP